jgi:deoxyadenosine/deoxycytidine kinase
MGKLVYVEGIIGAGKSKYAEEVGTRLEYRVMKEPVGDNPYLGPFYADQKAYAYKFQIYMLHRRIGLQQLAAAEALWGDKYRGAILDRSLFGDRCFAEMHHEAGNIDDLDMHAYETAVKSMQLMIFPPTTLVFLDADPSTALERIKTRNRGVEAKIEIDYLKKLRDKYHKLVNSAKDGRFPWSHAVKVLHIPWDASTTTDREWNAVASSLEAFQED